MSISMRRRTLPGELQQAVYELVTVRPYVPPDLRLTYAELLIYQRGYHEGVTRALRVMELRVKLDTLRRRAARERTPKKGAA